jgi:RecB family exonuclease
LERRRTVLEAIVAEHETSPIDEPEKRRHRWTPQKAEKWLADLTPLIPAVRALQSIAETVLAGAALKEIWPAVRKFVEDGYALPPSPPNLLAVLAERLESILADPIAERLRGLAAIDVLIAALGRERITEGRFGEPRVFIGTAKAAAGLTFKALRVLGAAEGALPRTPHDDPIVPNGLRSAIETLLRKQGDDTVIPRIEDRVLEDLHAFHRIVRSTKDYLSLSAPRQWLDRSEREVSGVLLEIDAALGRSRDGGEETSIGSRLRTAYFRDAQARCEAFVRDALPAPRHAMAHLPRQGAGSVKVPWQWVGDGPTAVDRTMDLLVAASQNLLCAGDGRIELALLQHRLPGLRNEQPVSATALVDLLRCPHQFLLQRVLFMTEPASRPSTDTIDASAYGSLFHSAAEAFFREAGPMVCGREGQLSHWLARAGEIASTKFDELRDEYPLRGADAIERERRRLVRQIEQLVRYEWELGLRSFVGAERSFGVEEPVVLQTGDGALHVRGAIDRVDRKAKQLSVRDLKTGRIRDFGEEPINPIRDLQIGLYTLVVEADPDLDARVTHAAYVHPSEALEMEREFAGSALQELRQHTQQWLRIARGLLRTGLFVRTPNEEDCRFCPFVPACGEGAQLRSAAKLSGAETEPELEDFVTIKVKRAEDE